LHQETRKLVIIALDLWRKLIYVCTMFHQLNDYQERSISDYRRRSS